MCHADYLARRLVNHIVVYACKFLVLTKHRFKGATGYREVGNDFSVLKIDQKNP